jgi:hypothetical protein
VQDDQEDRQESDDLHGGTVASHSHRQPPEGVASEAIVGNSTSPALCPTVAIELANERRLTNQLLTAPYSTRRTLAVQQASQRR